MSRISNLTIPHRSQNSAISPGRTCSLWIRNQSPALLDEAEPELRREVEAVLAQDFPILDSHHVSSSMRSIDRRAFLAMSSGTRTRGWSVSSDRITLSSVIVFMNAHST